MPQAKPHLVTDAMTLKQMIIAADSLRGSHVPITHAEKRASYKLLIQTLVQHGETDCLSINWQKVWVLANK